MTRHAAIRPMHRHDAESLIGRAVLIPASGQEVYALDVVAQALADAEEYGIRKALYRLGPIIADAEVAREQLASEVDL